MFEGYVLIKLRIKASHNYSLYCNPTSSFAFDLSKVLVTSVEVPLIIVVHSCFQGSILFCFAVRCHKKVSNALRRLCSMMATFSEYVHNCSDKLHRPR